MDVRVKICGITSISDAQAAFAAGADALGFMFYSSSPRHVTSSQAAAIIRELPPFIAKVGVFVNSTAAQVRQFIEESGIDTLQFHGDEPAEFCRGFGLKVIKAFRVRDEQSLQGLPEYSQEAWLLDAFVEGKLGGTGAQFNWALARKAVAQGGKVILAGGLTPENAAEAVRQVQPFALDVSSGVESAPGKKDPDKLKRFIAATKGF